MALTRKPALPDVFGRRLSWREMFIKNAEWLWFRPLPKNQAERELESEAELKAPEDIIKLNLDR